jgi:hypothetical protein
MNAYELKGSNDDCDSSSNFSDPPSPVSSLTESDIGDLDQIVPYIFYARTARFNDRLYFKCGFSNCKKKFTRVKKLFNHIDCHISYKYNTVRRSERFYKK